MSNAFDENALMDRIDDNLEFLEETIAMLDEDSPALLDQIRNSAASRDAESLVKAARALKGMLANFFCREPAEPAARRLETMQRNLLPTALPETLSANFAWHFEPCDELGGDILNLLPLRNQSVAMYLLDVTGHGVDSNHNL